MDLSELKPKDTFTFNLIHPGDGSVLDTTITVYGSDSKKYKAALHRIRNDRLNSRGQKMTSEVAENNGIEILVACTDSWENMVFDGEELECTKENVRRIYKEFEWIYEQVDQEVGNRANFLG